MAEKKSDILAGTTTFLVVTTTFENGFGRG